MVQDGEQAAVWNGPGGRGWVRMQAVLDDAYAPLEDVLVEHVRARCGTAGGDCLDVGCGTGGTTVAVAERGGPGVTCTGVDVSETMIRAARDRAERDGSAARFLLADAQRHAFEPGAFDLLVSRFGIMFFDDPVAAFATLRTATRPGGGLVALAWRGPADNPFMTAAERAAAPVLDIPARPSGGPGQFGFADRDHVIGILDGAGWADPTLDPVDIGCTFPEAHLTDYLTNLGPVGRVLDGADEATRARVAQAVRPAFDPFVTGDEVRFTAACWLVRATA